MRCTWQPSDTDLIAADCPRCGHAGMIHRGAKSCVVCDLEALVEKLGHLKESEL